MQLVKLCPLALRHAPDNLKNDRTIALMVVKANAGACQYISTELRGNFLFALEALVAQPSINRAIFSREVQELLAAGQITAPIELFRVDPATGAISEPTVTLQIV